MELDDINTITVLGAGNMGHGIAEVAALAGYEVHLRDINEEFVENGYDQIEWSLDKLAEKEQITEADAEDALGRVETYVDLAESVADADVVIEAVPERMDIKKDVYTELEAAAPEETVFATNTSSLSVTELAEVTERPERFCGMHFFNPPVRMQLVEVISGADTSAETMDLITDLAESMDKTPVRVMKDSPGFVANRILVPLMNEAAWIVESGDATVSEVDSTTKYGIGLPMGSFELADQVGIDVGYHVLEYMHEVLGDAYEPCPLLEEKVEAENLGKKTGKGFYDYEDGEGAQVPTDEVRDDVARRLTAVMANEVAGLLGNEVATVSDIDRALKLGGGFPDGPAKIADDAGLATLVETLDDLHEETGEERYEAVDYLRELAESGENFHGSADDGDADPYDFENVSVEVREGVGHLELDRPHRLNTISDDLIADLSAAVDALAADEDVRTILLTGAGDRAFSAGADIQSAAGSAGDPNVGAELSRRGQRTFGKLEDCDKPVVAAIDGYCLGGGMELSMCADLRVASKRSEFGQPEHDLGLLPGWGGSVRLQRIVGTGRAKEIIFTADRYDAETMADYGFVNEVYENDEFDENAFEYAKRFAQGPPIAQKYTKRAMHSGWEDTDAGLEVESQSFGLLFATDDLMEGMTAFMGDRDPEFEGK
ncbi:3-hydroxyacyl-CoA dehydrogenase/enoyl-CoA hydratase family protein [Halogeometricum sp. S1BR25-6]|uniref:enoyl-CoA hydratase n=1 Tax=Halogeometricum salsisoli TaxID=2950536 RepID=A0ABU2GGC5_9EURY|nr:3-hydroxyacyl-CoA dehydrogenase NAD-binding domain-containing protein [Halogeometricum sp. S1BR25-6]MDS0299153.1 3-hydroxyacyl-CoA dehydrogenase/enoyl-CoA hydratase family protein [Halogeometricum sp. S1BR25-6]